MFLKEALRGLADLFFPPLCIGCGRLVSDADCNPFCQECRALLSFIHSPLCSLCGLPLQANLHERFCAECLAVPPPFDKGRALGIYAGVLMEAIHKFKYQKKMVIGENLGRFMARYRYFDFKVGDYSLIMPIPLHPRRLRERGFNQALILARHLARFYDLPLDFLTLKRRVYTLPQVGLGKSKRSENVKDVFEVTDSRRVAGERVLLVDDVYTTGSTVKEAARTVLAGGAAKVGVLTLARA